MKLGLKTKATRLDKFFAVCGLLLLVPLLFTYNGQRSSGRDLDKLRSQVESAARDAREVAGSGDVQSARKRLAELQATAVSFATPAQAEVVAGSLWVWAQESGVNLEQMGYNVASTQVGDWSYPAHNFPISGKGGADKVVGFLGRLEAAELRTTGVSQLQITPVPGGDWQFSLVFTVWSQATKIEKKAGN